ncbi:MAG TPA: hypothetical protein VF760_11545 [Xanthobacteraceae bacterium]
MNQYDRSRWIMFALALAALAVVLSLAFCDRARAFTLVHVGTRAGVITVNADYAWRFREFINALPYTPRSVHCFAAHGHVRHSLHHIGAACDIDQGRRNSTAAPMYHIAALAHQFGLRDGCSFRDCGHVDIGLHRYPVTRIAHHKGHHHHYVQAAARRHLA